MEAIRGVYPEVPAERIHVWTLTGTARQRRLGGLWAQWRELGVHLVEDGWKIPGGSEVFTDAGTFAPVSRVGVFEDEEGRRHLFLCDGYAASAEAIQAASLDGILDNHTSMCLLSSTFELPAEREHRVMSLDAESPEFAADLAAVAGCELTAAQVERYRGSIRAARDAGMPVGRRSVSIEDFFPQKEWRVLAVSGFIFPDPWVA